MKVKQITASLLMGMVCLFPSQSSFAVELPSAVPVSIKLLIDQDMTSQTERILIEDHAAPYWNLTHAQAWSYYDTGVLKIKELIPDQRYELKYSGEVLTVLLDGNI
jgi:hypothetical protein